MIEAIETLNFLLAVASILMMAGILILSFDMRGPKTLQPLVEMWGMVAAFVLTLGSATMTLIYSEIFGFTPCGLCWLQRVCLYPQVILLGLAIWYKDKMAAQYGIALSIPGFVIAMYQHYLQMGGTELINCPAATAGDCAKRFMFEFGFITFPLMSAILFAFLIVLYMYILKTQN